MDMERYRAQRVWHQNCGLAACPSKCTNVGIHYIYVRIFQLSLTSTHYPKSNIKTMASALTTVLAATSLATLACAFTPPPHSITTIASIASKSSTSALYQELPFFAAPAFSSTLSSGAASQSSSSSSSSSSGNSNSPPQSATVTLRLPLGTLFDGRDYIFVTESNVRGYEWTEKEADILLDDFMVRVQYSILYYLVWFCWLKLYDV